MSRSLPRRLAVVAVAGGCLAAAALPAVAQDVDVAVTTTLPERQMWVENLTGGDLTAIDLQTGGQQPFRVRVTDKDYKPTTTESFWVDATMSNLYLETGSTYDPRTKVPSSAVSVSYGPNPLAAAGVSFPVTGKVRVQGLLDNCQDLPDSVKTALGLPLIGDVVLALDPTSAVGQLCDALGATGSTVDVTVASVVEQITPALNDLLALPTALEVPGFTSTHPFTHADYRAIGSDDPDATGAATPTPVTLLHGKPGLSGDVLADVQAKLVAAVAGLPLVAAPGTEALTTTSAVVGALPAGDVRTALGRLTADQVLALVGTLNGVLQQAGLGDLVSLSGTYYGFPVLNATPTSPVPGRYTGKLTVTFVQKP